MIQAKEFCEQYEQHEGSIVKPRGFITKIPVDDIADLIRTVTAEARDEGIDEMAGAICKFAPALRIEWVREEAERLKEKGK